jgi:hypothetical protein
LDRDALLRALRAEEAEVHRVRRRDLWIACLLGGGTTVFGALWLGALIYQNDTPVIYSVVAALGFGIAALWVGAYLVSRWRQAKSERNFGNTLQEELRRALSRVDIDIARFGSWGAAALQVAPIMLGGLLIAWSVGRSQSEARGDASGMPWMYPIMVVWMLYLVRLAVRHVKQKLEPRQRRLRELLTALDGSE